jgi:hypothetical protein
VWLHQVLSAVDGTKKALLMLIFGALRSVDTRQCQGFTLPLNRFLKTIWNRINLSDETNLCTWSIRCSLTKNNKGHIVMNKTITLPAE